MMNCNGCKHASWQKTAAGKLHPSGDGHCKYEYVPRELPASMYWIFSEKPSGGAINRRRELSHHCVYFAREEA